MYEKVEKPHVAYPWVSRFSENLENPVVIIIMKYLFRAWHALQRKKKKEKRLGQYNSNNKLIHG